jgi:16S rRNA (cytosine1402-N4)-methyltransferase
MVYNELAREYHIPVLVREVLDGLGKCFRNKEYKQKMVVDVTVGGMGHGSQIAKALAKDDKLICIDRDEEAIKENINKKIDTNASVVFVHDDFKNIKKILNGELADVIFADLGVSNHQIDTPERGFSYMQNGDLDMRMDRTQKRDAYHVVNNYSLERLCDVIYQYGEERLAKQISRAIVAARPVKTTGELSKIIVGAVPSGYFKTGGHPAKRTFQAIRIEVNRELEILEQFIYDAVDCLKPDGVIMVITFHSLEDRIVKQAFKLLSTDCICPPKTPKCICNHHATVNILTKKPIEPSAQELKQNPRCASAKLRIAQKKEAA